jgi:uncharacterized RDD family membrane protein YckC
MDTTRIEAEPATLWPRLFALVYDLFPMIGLWFLISALTLMLRGGEPVQPGSWGAALEFAALVGVTWLYAVLSWRRGGQTLGMRAWRLRAVDAHGDTPGWGALSLRFLVGVLSLAACGLGFLWVLIDRQRRSWHELASGTLTVRLPKG